MKSNNTKQPTSVQLVSLTSINRAIWGTVAPKLDDWSLDWSWVDLLHGADLLRDLLALGDQLQARDVLGHGVAGLDRHQDALLFRNGRHELKVPEK